MSCHGETNYNANGNMKDWKLFRDQTVKLAQTMNDPDFTEYVRGVSDRAWEHILEENFYTPQRAMEHLHKFYETDIVPYRA